MRRFLTSLGLALTVAAGVAAVVTLSRSGDPGYRVEEWLHFGRYTRYDGLIRDAAARRGLDPLLLKAVIWRESRFDAGKVGADGERGLMQVTEQAAADWVAAERVEGFRPESLFDPKTNIEAGSWYLAAAMGRWRGRDDPVPFALAEYNAGRSRVNRWVARTQRGEGATGADLVESISFPGTQEYVAAITKRYRRYRERGGAGAAGGR